MAVRIGNSSRAFIRVVNMLYRGWWRYSNTPFRQLSNLGMFIPLFVVLSWRISCRGFGTFSDFSFKNSALNFCFRACCKSLIAAEHTLGQKTPLKERVSNILTYWVASLYSINLGGKEGTVHSRSVTFEPMPQSKLHWKQHRVVSNHSSTRTTCILAKIEDLRCSLVVVPLLLHL